MKRIIKIEENKMLSVKKKIRVAAYCRVSTASDEQLISLDAQKAHYENYIKANDEWEYAGLYYDEGVTGTKKEVRDGLLSLIVDCEKGLIDLVITKSISRFCRNTTDCLELVRKLLGLNVYINFEKENLNTGSMESELMLSILSSLAESESVSISENEKWSIKKRFQNGTYIISYPPYGYANINGEMVIVPEQAEVVKQIFTDTLAGKSTHIIAKELNELGVKSKKGSKWTAGTVNAIIRNEKYTGDVIFQKSYTDSSFNRHTNYGEQDQYLCTAHHVAIASHEVFKKANEVMSQRGKEKGNGEDTQRYQNRYGFSGKIRCGECGSAFKRRIHNKPSGKYVAWCCTHHIEDKDACSMKYITDDSIKMAFLTMINKLIFAHQIVLKPLLRNLQGLDDKDRLLQIQEYESKLEKNMEQRQVLTSLMTSGILEPALFNGENNTLIQEEKMLQAEKDRLMHSVSGDRTRFDALKKLIKYVSGSEMMKEYEDEVFLAHVDKITVASREEIIFLLKCGLELKERMA
ncbi:recombinase family protein [Clostridium grantii]|uniref:Site-specific DNA recombinase n=1 Tax=Clostridium grantii DSM 8605 TaxID=1121316 RepID=A0A1M5U9E5_9CLOT|nr:recombinase family protein [Clostridium grantii]SHH59569.1 Site-specific DNA recombinase [Clostridium grantii DSM 8605]